MSKLSENINYVIEERKIAPMEIAKITYESERIGNFAVGYNIMYRAKVEHNVRFTLPEDRSAEEYRLAVDHAKSVLIEEIYGEFRKDLIDMRRHLLTRDHDKAVQSLNSLYNRMFEK